MALSLLAPATVRAEPAVLFVPGEDVELRPTGAGECIQENSALGCTSVVDMETTHPAYGDVAGLIMGLEAALEPYDVFITQSRPPAYLPYTMLLASDVAEPRRESFTCTAGGINCSALKRNDIIFTFGDTQNCTGPDPLHAALYAVGRASGLEGVSLAGDVMAYVPDYTAPLPMFLDMCSDRVSQLGFNDEGAIIDLPLECTSLDHTGCADDQQQNSHADLLDAYGGRVFDLDPPELSRVQPLPGAVLDPFDSITFDVEVSDADPVIGLRWTVSSPALESLGVPDGMVTVCTNDVCDSGWDGGPLKPTSSDWGFVLTSLPEGIYEVTLEASDFHGNVAEPVQFEFVVDDRLEPPETTSDTGLDTGVDDTAGNTTVVSTTGDSMTSLGSMTTAGATAAGGDGSTSGEPIGIGIIGPGCICSSTRRAGGGGQSLLLLLLLGASRRRRARTAAGRGVIAA